MTIGNLRLMDGCRISLGDFRGFHRTEVRCVWIDVVESMERFS